MTMFNPNAKDSSMLSGLDNGEKKTNNNIIDRMTSKTPRFFRIIRNVSITCAAVSGAILAIPATVITLPASVITIAGYISAVGIVSAAVAQSAKDLE